MQEDNGRFLRKASGPSISFSDGCLRIDGKTVIRTVKNRYVIQDNELCGQSSDCSGDPQNRLAMIANLLNKGKTVDALFIANASSWAPDANNREIQKANFNPAEPRSHGEWTSDSPATSGASPTLEDVQYRGYYHDFVVDNLINGLASNGSVLIKSIPVFGLNGVLAIPDGASLPTGSALPYFIEVKTGFDPKFTKNQEQVYPQICLGGHAISLDPRITRLGLIPGVPFPPLKIMLVYTLGPGMPMIIHDYCKDIGLGF